MIKLSMINLLSALSIFSSAMGAESISPIKFRQFVSEHISEFREDGKIAIPETVRHIKLDIGLSYSAPMSQHWLSNEKDLIVFGFEPYPPSVQSILAGAVKWDPSHGDPLNPESIGKNFFLIPCALGLADGGNVKFYVTEESCGCCSIYEPSCFTVAEIIDVPFYRLSDFFELFPFDTHPLIEYIKIDAQGADLDIVKSAGDYLKEHVLYVTIEAEDKQYKQTMNSEQEVDEFMRRSGFIRYFSPAVSDPTYVNGRFIDYLKEHKVTIYQQG